ncbi:CapA family protein [Komagataeibacter medellinensis]|uniref:CapA family protein n=1 Tax=Komagataeibacter medellinensis TaxID=1177712 RepID=A0ABQ6VSF8_9PROT|nr:CapA family protein [Komagataeibacter medellinensis]KAB8123138.1 CapA family protein [Komagataeibacter medellinensis]
MRIALTGDSILLRRLNSLEDETLLPLFDLIRGADVAFTNLEVLPNDFRGDPALESGGSHFGAPSWVIDELCDAGFDLFATATNHSLDYSISGLRAAMEAMQARELLYAGVGDCLEAARRPTYCTRPQGTVAMTSCTSSFATGQEAASQTDGMQGRPGPSALHFDTMHTITPGHFTTLRDIAVSLGLETLRERTIQLGFAFPPTDPSVLPIGGLNFRAGEQARITTRPNARDLADMARWVEEARMTSDRVIVSIHAHEVGYNPAGQLDPEIPAEFLRTFAHAMIDAGADIVAGHGPHLLRGLEIYRDRPIFYSLGNFIGQNELVPRLPHDSYLRFRADPDLTPAKVYQQRTQNDTKGFPAETRFWETVMPICEFDENGLKSIRIYPVSLGLGMARHRRGVPFLATGAHAHSIEDRFTQLSGAMGTTLARDAEGILSYVRPS